MERGVFRCRDTPLFFEWSSQMTMSEAFSIQEEADFLQALLQEIESVCQDFQQISQADPKISGWSVGQHCEHILKADRLNLRAIRVLLEGGGEPVQEEKAPHPILKVGVIPRGVAEAPRFVLPKDSPDQEQLGNLVQRVLTDWNEIRKQVLQSGKAGSEESRRGISHHELGLLDIVSWVRFARIHTDHHLVIIRAIQGTIA